METKKKQRLTDGVLSIVAMCVGGIHLVVELVEVHADVLDLELGVLEHGLGILAQLLVLLDEALAERLEHVLGSHLYLHFDLQLTVERLQPLLVRCQSDRVHTASLVVIV